MSRYYILLLVLLLALGLVGCGGKEAGAQNQDIPAPETVGNPDEGQIIFNAWHEDAPACSTCHAVEGNQTIVGPALTHIATRAGSRVNGLSTIDYLHQSIVEPDAYIANGEDMSLMYKHFGEKLTAQQIDDLVAYLLTLQ